MIKIDENMKEKLFQFIYDKKSGKFLSYIKILIVPFFIVCFIIFQLISDMTFNNNEKKFQDVSIVYEQYVSCVREVNIESEDGIFNGISLSKKRVMRIIVERDITNQNIYNITLQLKGMCEN